MRFHASQVGASAPGDYYQLFLGPEESEEDDADPFNVRGPYLMVQRQFEMFNGGRCYIESLDDNYVGELPLKLTDLSPMCLAFEIVRTNNNHAERVNLFWTDRFKDSVVTPPGQPGGLGS